MSLQIILQALHVSYCGPWPWQICAHVGNSLMLSGESGHNTAQTIPQNFFEQSGTEQRMWPGDTRPGANKWFLPRQPLKTPFQQPFVKGENKKRTEVKIYFGYLLRVLESIYLTPCVLTTGETIYLVTDNTWGHGARERRVESVSLTPRTVSSLAQTGIMLPANNETRVTRQLASQETR